WPFADIPAGFDGGEFIRAICVHPRSSVVQFVDWYSARMNLVSDEPWLRRRTALHDRYLEVARVGDSSRLAYLHGPETVWSEEEVAGMWERAARQPIGDMPSLNCVYIHVPFCKSICNFCNYDRLPPSSPSLLKTWLARVLRSIDVIAPAVRPLTFHALYI